MARARVGLQQVLSHLQLRPTQFYTLSGLLLLTPLLTTQIQELAH